MRFIFLIILLIFSNNLICQQLEFFGGVNNNVFHDYRKNEGHYKSSYESDYGFSVGVGLDSIKINSLKLRFILQFDKYKGKLEASDGGLGGSYTTFANIDKSIISLVFFPVNIKIIRKIDLNFGAVFSKLIYETYEGTNSGWQINKPNWSYKIEDKFNRYNSSLYFGLQARVAYDFLLSNSIAITPQYLHYFGITNEFIEFPKNTKSLRNYFFVSVKKKLY